MIETLEQAAERIAYDSTEENKGFPSIKTFIKGAKWMEERMYSEEDMNKYAEYCTTHVLTKQIGSPYLSVNEWFKQKEL
jgi:hypothetical protein